MDLLARQVTRAGTRIDLQAREFALLEYLMRNSGRPVSRTMILQHVWDYAFDSQTNVVEVLVSRLRSKVDGDLGAPMIQTIRGVGYVLRTPYQPVLLVQRVVKNSPAQRLGLRGGFLKARRARLHARQ